MSKCGYTTSESAKLLISFFRGDGTLPGFGGEPAEAERLRKDLGRLREEREHAFKLLSDVALTDLKQPALRSWEPGGLRR